MTLSLPKNVQVWGLTGGIGSGKSLAAQYFEGAGIPVINLDLLGRELLENDSVVHQEIKQLLGESIITPAGVDRSAIRGIVFRDSAKRESLEKILHPRIWKLFTERAEAKARDGAKVVFCEAALLIEHHHAKIFPRLIVVLANEEIRRERVAQRDKMAMELIDKVLKSQTDDETRKTLATDLIFNEGSASELKKSVEALVSKWKKAGVL